MAKTVIVKLLGWRITFNALLNKDDYNDILTKGPWVIFRQYLTVRPWSLGFLVEQNEIDTQVVWVRLPGLSEGYYTSFILKAIGQVTGS
ncbi:hypothetical protein Golob_017830, partial [Gossypium lobatum]|nr:hypothetical protein [Gossypium lobatum]